MLYFHEYKLTHWLSINPNNGEKYNKGKQIHDVAWTNGFFRLSESVSFLHSFKGTQVRFTKEGQKVISQKTSHGDKRKYLFCKTVSIPFIEKYYVQQVSPFIIFYGIFDFTTSLQFSENMGLNSDFNGASIRFGFGPHFGVQALVCFIIEVYWDRMFQRMEFSGWYSEPRKVFQPPLL